jgi:NHLM bacteriocin system ABC transporter ATP-binding protein
MDKSAAVPISPPPAIVGEVVELAENATLTLTCEEGFWFVEQGELDLFAVNLGVDGRTGMRHHLATSSSGGLLAGLEWPASDPTSLAIVAISRGARLRRLPADAFNGVPDDPALTVLGRGLDSWTIGLLSGITRFFNPRPNLTENLGANQHGRFDAGMQIGCPRGLVWAQLTEGSAGYLGIETVTAGTSPLLALTPDSWLSVETDAEITGHSTDSLVRTPGRRGQFSAFHQLWLRTLMRSVALAAEDEGRRLAKRRGNTDDAVDHVLSKFAQLAGAPVRVPPAHDPDQALAIACSIACRPLGIAIEASPLMARRRTLDRKLTVEDVARTVRLRVRRVALRGDWWAQDLGPLVGFHEVGGEPVALVPERDGRYRMHSGATNCIEIVDARLATRLEPMAWSFYAPLPEGRLTPFGLLRLGLRHQAADIATALAAGAASGLLGLALPILAGWTFREIIPGHLESQLAQVGLALVMAAIATTIFKVVGDVALLRMEGRIAGRLQAGIVDRLLRLPSRFFSAYSTGDLSMRTMTVETVRKALAGLVLSATLATTFSVFGFGLLLWYQPAAAAMAGGLFLIVQIISVWSGASQLKAILEGEKISSNINSLVIQLIAGIPKLRMAGAEDRAFVQWGRVFAELRTRMVRMRRIANTHAAFLAGYDIIAMAMIFTVITLAAGTDMDTGSFLAFITAFTMFMSATTQMSRAVVQCFNVAPMVKLATPLLEAPPEVDASKTDPGQLLGEVEVTGVVFRYGRNEPKVLNGLSFSASAGQFIALVGPSGCGKSTLMKLLLGFEQPDSGGIFLDGQDIRTLDIEAVRRQMGVVLQSGRLMPGTIYENIKGATDADVDDAWNAAAMAGMDADIKAMPMAMHTVLTEGASTLSGGQVQRLLIARAVVNRPRILLFDEATSALDNVTQAVATECLSRLSVTRIVIAHRMSTVRDADYIYVLRDGCIQEHGKFAELIAKKGLFSELARYQLT